MQRTDPRQRVYTVNKVLLPRPRVHVDYVIRDPGMTASCSTCLCISGINILSLASLAKQGTLPFQEHQVACTSTSGKTRRQCCDMILKNITMFFGVLMAIFTISWISIDPQRPDRTLKSTSMITISVGWMSSTLTFSALHCIHLQQAEYPTRHWSTLQPYQNFVLRVIAVALFMSFALDLHATEPITWHLVIACGPPVLSGSALVNSLWDPTGNSLNMAGGVCG